MKKNEWWATVEIKTGEVVAYTEHKRKKDAIGDMVGLANFLPGGQMNYEVKKVKVIVLD